MCRAAHRGRACWEVDARVSARARRSGQGPGREAARGPASSCDASSCRAATAQGVDDKLWQRCTAAGKSRHHRQKQ